MKIILFLFLLFNFSSVWAGEKSAVEQYIFQAVEKQVHMECPTCQISLDLHNPKILEDIEKPDAVIGDHWKGQTNLVLKMGADGRVVTATIRWKDQVVVANKNIKQGAQITKKDIRVVEKDVTFLKAAYLQKPEDVIGWEGKRLFKRGQVIDESYLRKPLVVKYGQPLKVKLESGALSLEMAGQARGAGAIGDRIPVMIEKTRTKVYGKVIDKYSVRVE